MRVGTRIANQFEIVRKAGREQELASILLITLEDEEGTRDEVLGLTLTPEQNENRRTLLDLIRCKLKGLKGKIAPMAKGAMVILEARHGTARDHAAKAAS